MKNEINGPVTQALLACWNTLNDIEYDLRATIQEYDVAASYVGKPGQEEAREMIRLIKETCGEIHKISTERFGTLVDTEQEFVKRNGTPEVYVERCRDAMFPH